jgi:hypothetical protein
LKKSSSVGWSPQSGRGWLMKVKTFAAHYWREDDRWEAVLVDDESVHIFASTLGRARRYIREAAAETYGLDVDQVAIEDYVELPGGLGDEVLVLLGRRAEVEQAATEVAEQTRNVISGLLRAGLSLRDAGGLVKLSRQRVHQLAPAAGAHDLRLE